MSAPTPAVLLTMAARLKLQGRAHGLVYARAAAFDALEVIVLDAPHLAAQAADLFRDVLTDIDQFHELQSLDHVDRRLQAGL